MDSRSISRKDFRGIRLPAGRVQRFLATARFPTAGRRGVVPAFSPACRARARSATLFTASAVHPV